MYRYTFQAIACNSSYNIHTYVQCLYRDLFLIRFMPEYWNVGSIFTPGSHQAWILHVFNCQFCTLIGKIEIIIWLIVWRMFWLLEVGFSQKCVKNVIGIPNHSEKNVILSVTKLGMSNWFIDRFMKWIFCATSYENIGKVATRKRIS